jgi:hypothetical protein
MDKIIELIEQSSDQITGIVEVLDTIAHVLNDYELTKHSKHISYIANSLIKIRDNQIGGDI